jgi:S-adenosylmethionine decarboxylase
MNLPRSGSVEWLVDARGCDPARLRDADVIKACVLRLVAEMDLRPLGEPFLHTFPEEGGVTGMLALRESHVACHTFPENGYAAFSLYCCRPRPEWPWRERLAEMLGASEVFVRAFPRG